MLSPRRYALSQRLRCRGSGDMSGDRGQHVGRVAGRAATAFLGLALAVIAGGAVAYAGPPSDEPSMPASDASRAPANRTEPLRHNVIADKPAWKQVTLGTHPGVHALRQALDAARVRIGDSADEILGRPAFSFSHTRLDVDLIVVRVAELGFVRLAPLSDIHRRANELGLELCPAEVAPLLRLAYTDQPLGEFLNIAMKPIATYAGELVTLSIANAGTGPVLLGGEARADLMVSPQASFVFVRPQRIALPDVR